MDVRKFRDVSSFFLFEATGDSDEAAGNSDLITTAVPGRFYDHNTVAMDEDDAESCSCDLTDHSLGLDDELNSGDALDEEYLHDDDDNDRPRPEYWKEEEEEEEEEEDVGSVYQTWGAGGVGGGGGGGGACVDLKKSCASLDSTKEFELLNEVEKNRVFWETCLAS